MWEAAMHPNETLTMKRMSAIGAGQIRIGEKRLWTNSDVNLDKMVQEKERRKFREENAINPANSVSWGSIIKEATKTQIDRREMSGFEVMRETPARIFLTDCDKEKSWNAVYYMDSAGEFWDEI